MAAGQRGENGQPGGMLAGLGGAPGICGSRARRDAICGLDAPSPAVYGWWGAENSDSTGASSAIRPAYRTIARWHSSRTTPRSWVMRSSAIPRSRTRSRRSSRICAWMVTSSAVVGSSAMSSSGSHASAIAIITRWRIPPESSWGYWPTTASGSGSPTSANRSRARRNASDWPIPKWNRSASATCSPARYSGLRAVSGSWNTIPIRSPRILR